MATSISESMFPPTIQMTHVGSLVDPSYQNRLADQHGLATTNGLAEPPVQPIAMVQLAPTTAMAWNDANASSGEYFYYSLFAQWLLLVGPIGAPFPSSHPTDDLPCTSCFPFVEIPEPRLVKNLLEFIGTRENIHPSRLWFSSLRGNERQRMAPPSGVLRGLPSTAEVPPAPDATNAVIITVHLSRSYRREDATTSPPIVFRCFRAIYDTTRRMEHGCETAVGSTAYHRCGAIIECCTFMTGFLCVGGLVSAAAMAPNRARE